jgi:hypothetical protein
LIDLFLVSVLLDAGAGMSWSFKSAENGRVYRRSEGLALASLEMFKSVSADYLAIQSTQLTFSAGSFLRQTIQSISG